MKKVIAIVGGTISIQLVLFIVFFVGSHMFEMLAPRSYRYTYKSVSSEHISYSTGEAIYISSNVTRKRIIQTRREDTLYCEDGKRTKKYPTQYRPKDGTEYPKIGQNISSWIMDMKPLESELLCYVCGTVVSNTELGYSKDRSYCSNKFGVNGNHKI